MTNNLVSNVNIKSSESSGVVYTPETSKILKGSSSGDGVVLKDKITTKKVDTSVNHGLFLNDIAQSHHYTVHLSGLSMSRFKVPSGTYSEFLPVKTMNLNYTSYENMSIPVSIFGDFPLLNKKRVSTISLACYDLDDNSLEKEIREWEGLCFPKGKYAAYMEDITRKLTYRGYNTKGKETLSVTLLVIPSGNVSVSRDTSANDAKMVNFSLVCVGDGLTTATGAGDGVGGQVEAVREVSAGIVGSGLTAGRRVYMGQGII